MASPTGSDTIDLTLKSTRFRLTIAQKVELLDLFREGKTRSELSRFFNIPPSTLSQFIRDEAKIREEYTKFDPNRLAVKESPYRPLESALVKWIELIHEKNIPINGPIIQEKALELAEVTGVKGFTASNGWLHRFKKRLNVDFKGRNCSRRILVLV